MSKYLDIKSYLKTFIIRSLGKVRKVMKNKTLQLLQVYFFYNRGGNLIKNKTLQLLQVGNIIAVILTIIVNGLANILPIGGKNTGELSDNIPNLFVPAGLTFAIWGIIYVLIILFAIYLVKDLFTKEKTTKPFLEKISYFFILASLANIIWIFLWHYEQIVLSLLAMI